MKKRKRTKSCLNKEMELDRISSLPRDVIEKILSLLPIKGAARTSVLSNKWRYQFAMLPHLVFECLCRSNIVDHVLLTHIGSISKFRLVQGLKDIVDIDRWVLHLSRYPLKEFILLLGNWEQQRYDMPSCIFSCQDMIHLKLSCCLLKPPSTFKGFRSLKSLAFLKITMAQDVFEHLIVCSPLLESLTLRDCDGFCQLNINAPNLQFLEVVGSFEDVSMVNMLNLADVSIRFGGDRGSPCSSGGLIKFIDDLPRLQRLQINRQFLKYLAGGALLKKLPKPCLNLKHLRFSDLEDTSTALCLIKSSPALEKLEISAVDFPSYQPDLEKVNSFLDDNQSCSFTRLRHVKIMGISGVEADLNLIRFLLESSPVLETMTVHAMDRQLALGIEPLDLAQKLLRLKRASANLEVIYIDKLI